MFTDKFAIDYNLQQHQEMHVVATSYEHVN